MRAVMRCENASEFSPVVRDPLSRENTIPVVTRFFGSGLLSSYLTHAVLPCWNI